MQCAAIAAAATGDPKNVEYKHIVFRDILTSLQLGEVDIVSAGITHTMERQVFQVRKYFCGCLFQLLQ